MWKESASRRYGVRSWANSVWRVLRSPWDRAKSPIKFKHCITAPRSYWRSSGGIGSRVAVRTARRQSITPRRYTNSTWSTVRQKVVSIETLQITKFLFISGWNANGRYLRSVRNYAAKEPVPSRRTVSKPQVGEKICSWNQIISLTDGKWQHICMFYNYVTRIWRCFVHMCWSLPALVAQAGFVQISRINFQVIQGKPAL